MRHCRRNSRGFTLVELMVVVVIVAILAAVALPAYQNTLRKSRRSDAHTALQALQLAEEKYRLGNTGYGTIDDLRAANVGGFMATSDGGYYTLGAVAATNSFTLTATPVTGSTQAQDSDCPTITLTSTNGSLSYGPSSVCWNR